MIRKETTLEKLIRARRAAEKLHEETENRELERVTNMMLLSIQRLGDAVEDLRNASEDMRAFHRGICTARIDCYNMFAISILNDYTALLTYDDVMLDCMTREEAKE